MDFVRTISRSGNATNNSETELNINPPHAAVVPAEDAAAAPASAEEEEDNNSHAAVPVVVENPSERDERKDAADDDSEGDSEEDEYEYEEDEDEAAFSSFLVDQPALTIAAASLSSGTTTSTAVAEQPTKIEEEEGASARWREPSREAVTMSLRAEKETSGSKRRLAQDLYRIMNKDTSVTGFVLEPAVEDQMDSWRINLFQFDEDSMLAKDLAVLGLDSVELEMSFPEQYPFSPPFVRVVRPRFKRQTGFVMNGALCMELLTNDGWNPVNDIESVIVSIRSLLVVGEGRVEAAASMSATQYASALEAARSEKPSAADSSKKRLRTNSAGDAVAAGYSVSEAKAAYEHLSSYHKKKGWDQSGWWAKKG